MADTLTGEVLRVTYENEENGFRVVQVRTPEGSAEPIAVVGRFAPVGPGMRIIATGTYQRSTRFGQQFQVETLVPMEPETLSAMERYLASGVLPGIGPKLAERIVQAFGADTFRVFDHHPERLRTVTGIGARKAKELSVAWTDQRGSSELLLLLQSYGVTASLAAKIRERYAERAAEVVQRQPYRLAMEVSGIGFRTADRIAQAQGIAGDHPERVQAGLLHALSELEGAGHVRIPRTHLLEQAAAFLAVDLGHVEAALEALWAKEFVVVATDGVASKRLHQAEEELAQSLRSRLVGVCEELPAALALTEFERSAGLELAPQQRAAVELVARVPVAVVTGGPGVGKTTIVRAMLALFEAAKLSVALAAPTGRAAKRLAESTGHEAKTLHRLLEVQPPHGHFTRGPDRPLEFQVVIVDEVSMVDLPLATALVRALGEDARLVLVGDADQLPSVGPGAVLRDLLASGVVPTVRLTEVFRQAQESRIVANAHRIFAG